MRGFRGTSARLGRLLAIGLLAVGTGQMAAAQQRATQQVRGEEQQVIEGQQGAIRGDQRLGDPNAASRDDVNSGAVAVVSGGLNGTYARIASDLSSVLDGDEVRVLPILGKGAVQNVKDILFLRGVDLGLVRTDSLEAIRREGKISNVESQLTYIARIMNDEMHLVTSKDITDIRQLAGKKVNFDVVGSGSYFTSTLVFERLGIPVEISAFEQADAYEKLRKGELDASIFWGGKPVRGFASFENKEGKYHLLSVPFDDRLQDLYLPTTLTSKDYPNLISGEGIETIAASTVLAAYNWKKNTDRYDRVAKFVNAFFSQIAEFQKPPRHPKWADANLAATVPGWRRFPAAQEWLDKNQSQPNAAELKTEFNRFIGERERRTGVASTSIDQNTLFKEFLQWRDKSR